MDKKNIIIVGYPKSGTTWLSRLVAELVSCPFQGNWGFEYLNTPNKEGLDRESNFKVYKTHCSFNEINKVSDKKKYKIIYIIRDPRDIVISGLNYFTFYPKYLRNHPLLMKFSFVRSVISKLVFEKEKKKEMIKAVLSGNGSIDQWLSNSWKSHYETYIDKDILFIKFEDLVISPQEESHKILNYLGIQASDEHLKKSIFKQSFQNRKRTDIHKTGLYQKKGLRKGEFGYWKEEFSEDEKNLFKNKLKSSLYTF